MYLRIHLAMRNRIRATSRESVAHLPRIYYNFRQVVRLRVLSERRAYRSGVSVVEADIADQRSSKLAVESLFASTARSFNIVVPGATTMPSVQGACDLMVAAVAATVSRATATNPVIVRCLVIRTSSGPKPLSCGSWEFRGGSTAMRQLWIARIRRRTMKLSQIQSRLGQGRLATGLPPSGYRRDDGTGHWIDALENEHGLPALSAHDRVR